MTNTYSSEAFIIRPDAKKIGLISDTHVPDRAKSIPKKLNYLFKNVDLILHAGDITAPGVLDELADIAECFAVRGNNSGDKKRFAPPLSKVMTVELAHEFRLRIFHGVENFFQRVMDNAVGRAGFFPIASQMVFKRVQKYSDNVDGLLFGHCHWPFIRKHRDVIYVNPGRGFKKSESSCGILTLKEQQIEIQILPLGAKGRLAEIMEQKHVFGWHKKALS